MKFIAWIKAQLANQVAPEWVRHYVPAVLVILALLTAGLWLRNFWLDHQQEQVGHTVIATPAHEVKNAPKVGVQIKAPVKIYKGGSVLKGQLKLPAEIIAAPEKEVLASNQVKADDHPHTITTLLNTETGESETYVRTDPLPWFALSSRGGVGVYAGIKNGTPAVRLQVDQELFTVKAIRFGAIASVDQPISGPIGIDWFAGVGAEYRW